jgi:hypothetical protein
MDLAALSKNHPATNATSAAIQPPGVVHHHAGRNRSLSRGEPDRHIGILQCADKGCGCFVCSPCLRIGCALCCSAWFGGSSSWVDEGCAGRVGGQC